jgi:hypothetical protein
VSALTVFLALAPLAAVPGLRNWPPRVMATLCAVWVLAVAYALIGRETLVLSQAGTDRGYHETTYVIVRHAWLPLVAPLFLIGGAIWIALARAGRLHYPRIMAASLLAAHLVITAGAPFASGWVGRPRRYIDYPEAFDPAQMASTVVAVLAVVALLTCLTAAAAGMARGRR